MDTEKSNEFLKTLLQQFHVVCKACVTFKDHVKISGSLVVEIDNMKKERYVISELLQSSGNVFSESYCSKSCKTLPGTSRSSKLLKDQKETKNRHEKSSSSQTPLSSTKRKLPTGSLSKGKHHTDNPDMVTKNTSLEFSDNLRATSSKVLKVSNKFNDQGVSTSSMQIQPRSATEHNKRKELNKSALDFDPEVIDLTLFDDDLDLAITIKGEGEDSNFEAFVPSDEQALCVDSGQNETVPESQVLDTQNHFEVLSNPTCIVGNRSQYSERSVKLVTYAVNRFRNFINNKFNAEVNILFTSPEILNEMFLMYFTEGRKRNGQGFSGLYMKTMISYFDVFLRSKGYLYSVTKGPEFQPSRDYVKSNLENKISNLPCKP